MRGRARKKNEVRSGGCSLPGFRSSDNGCFNDFFYGGPFRWRDVGLGSGTLVSWKGVAKEFRSPDRVEPAFDSRRPGEGL